MGKARVLEFFQMVEDSVESLPAQFRRLEIEVKAKFT
jgi:hypothetical protein